MSTNLRKNKGLISGLLGNYAGKINSLIFQRNGRLYMSNRALIKRSRKRK